jgi:hypothetical protein
VVKAAVFAAGGGRIGDYDHCAWQTLGQGQFRPLDGSQPPWAGRPGRAGREWKVELVVADELIVEVVGALKRSHPYETPAYEVWPRAADSKSHRSIHSAGQVCSHNSRCHQGIVQNGLAPHCFQAVPIPRHHYAESPPSKPAAVPWPPPA